MCGLAGYYAQHSQSTVKYIKDALHHRGPDDYGIWQAPNHNITLIHRRLSILDLSSTGHQPMHSNNNRYVMVFNGEIYNHLELRQQLNHFNWRGHSDTETLLACFEHWGIEHTLQQTIGMFAIALWDRANQQLTLARDRMGEKPLYYGWQGNSFLFGSELKALQAHPDFQKQIDRNALSLLLRHNYIPSPYSIYQGIRKLTPGCYLTIDLSEPITTHAYPNPTPYWSLQTTITTAKQNPFFGDDQAAINLLEDQLSKAVQRQQLSDVPLGAFLSGGIDSSTIVALMQANTDQAINTFTIGFNNHTYNEAIHAKAIAKHLGTKHTELYIDEKDALDVIPKLPNMYDEPFADSSQIPTYLVAKLARQHVTVSLSGDAGDELFAGYNRYMWTTRLWKKISRLPLPMRNLLTKLILSLPPSGWDQLNRLTQVLQAKSLKTAQLGDKLHKLGTRIEGTNSIDELYYRLVSEWQNPEQVVLGSQEPPTIITQPTNTTSFDDYRETMMYLDSLTYLPDDILTKVDRAAMSVSLETRIPFLDHNLIELAWRLPMHMKIRNGQSKWLVRQVLYRHVPKTLIERPKMGFAIPLDQWLRGSLRDWAEDLLDENKLKQQGYFNAQPIRKRWQEHLSGSRNHYYALWSVLMFQAWLQEHHIQ